MRWLGFLTLIVAACGASDDPPSGQPPDAAINGDGCPPAYNGAFGDEVEGTACATSKVCFVENQFSSCQSGFYRCLSGTWHVDHYLGATNGAACGDSPIASCNYEGNPGCDTAPTAESCSCDADGTWHCTCACADPQRATCI
jgi:hypothetical protein